MVNNTFFIVLPLYGVTSPSSWNSAWNDTGRETLRAWRASSHVTTREPLSVVAVQICEGMKSGHWLAGRKPYDS